jgi:hypothetical protein
MAFPWMRIRYSDRTSVPGYFLLVLPDGTVATQLTDGRDKVALGPSSSITIEQMQASTAFHLPLHGQKWLAVVHCGAESPLDLIDSAIAVPFQTTGSLNTLSSPTRSGKSAQQRAC